MSENPNIVEPKVQTEFDGSAVVDTNLQEIVDQVFSIPPRPACSFGLVDVDTGEDNQTPEEAARTVFEVLMTLTLKGMKVKYGQEVDPRRLSESQIDTLKEYLRSFGWDFKILSTSMDDSSESEEHRSKFTPKDVDWYRLRLPDFEYKLNHDIVFNAYRPPVIGGRLYNV